MHGHCNDADLGPVPASMLPVHLALSVPPSACLPHGWGQLPCLYCSGRLAMSGGASLQVQPLRDVLGSVLCLPHVAPGKCPPSPIPSWPRLCPGSDSRVPQDSDWLRVRLSLAQGPQPRPNPLCRASGRPLAPRGLRVRQGGQVAVLKSLAQDRTWGARCTVGQMALGRTGAPTLQGQLPPAGMEHSFRQTQRGQIPRCPGYRGFLVPVSGA